MSPTGLVVSKETTPPDHSSRSEAPPQTRALGYASIPRGSALDGPQMESQRDAIATACTESGLELVEVVREREPARARVRSGLSYLLERVEEGEATCVVVASLLRLSRDVADLAPVLDRLERADVRLIATDVGLDTASDTGAALFGRREASWVRPAEAVSQPSQEPARAPAEPPPPPAVKQPTVIGYASASADAPDPTADLDAQREAIEQACGRLGAEIVEVVRDLEPKAGKALDRPGLSYMMGRVAAGESDCIVVAGLERMSHSVAELGPLLHWLEQNEIRLVALDLELDTSSPGGRSTARALASVGGWEHERLSERTRKGLAAARAKRRSAGSATSTDFTAVRERIASMRSDGMTLQAIADVLNQEGVPTQRGGAKWRPSSVQTAAGYKRKPRAREIDDLPAVRNASEQRPPARKPRS